MLRASPPHDANAAGNGQLAVTYIRLPPWCPCTRPTVSQENAAQLKTGTPVGACCLRVAERSHPPPHTVPRLAELCCSAETINSAALQLASFFFRFVFFTSSFLF